MNGIASVEILGPEGRTEACAKFIVDDKTVPFVLNDICVPGNEYMLGFWIKSAATGKVTAGGKGFVTTTDWTRCEAGFEAAFEDVIIMFDEGEYYIYHAKLEKGNKATDWSPAPEDGETAIEGAYSEINQTAENIRFEVGETTKGLQNQITENKTSIELTSESITSTVERVETLEGNVKTNTSNITVLSNSITSKVTELENGIKANESAITQTATDIRLEVNGIIGGINLVKDSAKGASGTGYPLTLYLLGDKIAAGETVTFTIYDSSLGSGKTNWALYDYSGIHTQASLQKVSEGVYSATFNYNGNGNTTGLALYAMPGSVTTASTVGKVKLERGSRMTPWSPSPLDPVSEVIAGSTVLINKEKVSIRTPEFEVNTIGAQFNIPGSENGEGVVQIDAGGLYANSYTGPIVQKVEGRVYTIAEEGGDFQDLKTAFSNINNKNIESDVILKMADSYSTGGTLEGVGGAGRVVITPINMLNTDNMAGWTKVSTSVTSMGGSTGVYMTPSSAGPSRYSILNVGHVGPMGIRGKTMTLRCTMYTHPANDPTYPAIAVVCGGFNWVWLTRDSSVAAGEYLMPSVTFTIPERAGYWDELKLYFYTSVSESITATATAYFRNPRLEIGSSISTLNTGNYYSQIEELKIGGCSTPICLHGLSFPAKTDNNTKYVQAGIEAIGSTVGANRCTFNGTKGFMLWGGSGAMYNCYGACTEYAARAAGGGAIEIFGTYPSGTQSGLIDTSNAIGSDPGSNLPVPTKPDTFKATTSGTYSGGRWWTSDAALRQGYTTANGKMIGAVWFEGYTASTSGVEKITVRLKRAEGYGKGGDVKVRVYGTTASPKSENPAASGKISADYVEKNMAPGEVKTFDMTPICTTVNYAAYVIMVEDDSVMSGKTYSTNFARFTGTGGGDSSIPLLTVKYRT